MRPSSSSITTGILTTLVLPTVAGPLAAVRLNKICLTSPIATPLNLTAAPTVRPLTLPSKKQTNSWVCRNRFPEPSSPTPSTASAIAPITNAPTKAGFARLAICLLRVFRRFATRQKFLHPRFGRMCEHFVRVAAGDHGVRLRIEEDAVVGDRKDARQFMAHHHHGCAKAIAQSENQFVEQARAYRIEAGRWVVG